MNRVAITGLGCVSPLGADAPSTWSGLVAGRSGVREISTFDASGFAVRFAGMAPEPDLRQVAPDPTMRRHLSRAAAFGLAAAKEAIVDAGPGALDAYAPGERGVAVGSSVGRPSLDELAHVLHTYASTGGRRIPRQAPADVLRRSQNVGGAMIARLAGCRGPLISVSTACAGSAHAIGEAYRCIQDGETRLMLAGGFDSLTSWLDVLGFSLLGALTTDFGDDPGSASRPFDARRRGFVLGEGAVLVVLEDWQSAVERGAPIHAELAGYGSSLNAYRITDSPPDGGGAVTAMRAALDDAGAAPEDIDYVAAHGTGTPGNDASETAAIKRVFGLAATRLAISSPKSMAGHLTSAAAGLNLLAALGALRDQVVPPTINLDQPDPKLDLDYVPKTARPCHVRAAMVNAFAFGGTNAALVVRRADAA